MIAAFDASGTIIEGGFRDFNNGRFDAYLINYPAGNIASAIGSASFIYTPWNYYRFRNYPDRYSPRDGFRQFWWRHVAFSFRQNSTASQVEYLVALDG